MRLIRSIVCVGGGRFLGSVDKAVTLMSFELVVADTLSVLFLEISVRAAALIAHE